MCWHCCVRGLLLFLAAVKTSSTQKGKGIMGVCPAAKPQAHRRRKAARHVCSMAAPSLVRAPPACAEERRACTVPRHQDKGGVRPRQGESMPVWYVCKCCGLEIAVRKMSGGGWFSTRLAWWSVLALNAGAPVRKGKEKGGMRQPNEKFVDPGVLHRDLV